MKKKQPIRVLHIVTSMNRAGLETMLMNYYRNVDRSKVQFDFLVHRSEKGDYHDEIIELGGRIHHFSPITIGSMLTYSRKMATFLFQHPEYKIVHSHLDALSALPLAGAKAARVPLRIAHSHNSGFSIDAKYPLRVILRGLIANYATDLFACSEGAGSFMFGRKSQYRIIKNAIDTRQFAYNPSVRRKVREQLGLGDDLVFGHVGRFSYQKNHDLLIYIFNEVAKQRKNARLLLIGTGELEDIIKDKVRQLGLEEKVRFLGVRRDIPDLMQAMDVFVMPSRYEGLPVVSVEAQASGLRCVFSDVVTRDLDVTGLCSFVDLSDLLDWTSELTKRMNTDRTLAADAVVSAGYDIADAAHKLQTVYIDGGRSHVE